MLPQTKTIFILTSLLALDNLYVAVHGGSKSSKASSKTTVIAIDGGGGGGRPQPVPIPWPVVHCHHHHHHLKYVPKPVLVHHWVKKGRGAPTMVEDFAASSFEKQQVPVQLMEQPESLQLPESSHSLLQESGPHHLEHGAGEPSMVQLEERPYALASGHQTSLPPPAQMASAFQDDDQRLLAEAMSLSIARNGTFGSNSTTQSKPSHPFKGQFGDQLRDESSFGGSTANLQAKLNKLNLREQAEAKRTFDRFATEQASKLIALQAFNQALMPAIKHINSQQSGGAKGAQSAGLPLQVDSRAMSESRAIELVTKLAEQMAQTEAKRMLLRAAAVAAQQRKSQPNSSLNQKSQQQKQRRNGGLFASIFTSNENQPKIANKRRASFANPLQFPFLQRPHPVASARVPNVQQQHFSENRLVVRPVRHLSAMKMSPNQEEGDQLATEASGSVAKLAEPSPGVATGDFTTPPNTTPASTSTTASSLAKTSTSASPTTMSPEQENNFYLSQHQQLFGSFAVPQINTHMPSAGGFEYLLEPMANHLLSRRPREQPHQSVNLMPRYKWQASDVHNLIAEAPQHLLGMNNSGQSLNAAASFGDQFQLMAAQQQQQQPQQYLRDLDPFSAHSFASLVTKTPQEVAMEQQQQQMFPQLASPYLEFPLTPEKWSSEALRSVNMNFKQAPSSSSGPMKSSASSLQELVEEQEANSATNNQPEELYQTSFATGDHSAAPSVTGYNQQQQGDPLLGSSQQLSASSAFATGPNDDPIVSSAAADMQSMRQLQATLTQQQQQLGAQQANFTAMTRLSRQLRDQMRSLQGRLPQIPNIPQPPQVPNLPMPPPGMMQMAGMALPFALARATRSSRDRQTQQVNAAAQSGGTTAGAASAAPGVRQRVLNRALSLTNRLARPRPRRPATSASQGQSSSSSSSSGSQRNPRQRLFGVVRTVIDLSRRPAATRRPLSPLAAPAMRPKIDEGRGLVSRALARTPTIAGRMSTQLDHSSIHYLPSTVMATMTDGSLAGFPSMTSPMDLLSGAHSTSIMMDDWPRIRPATSPAVLNNHYELRNHRQSEQQPQQQHSAPSNSSLVFRTYDTSDLARHLELLPTSPKATTQKHPPLVANHINLLLITAQNVTQGAHHHHPSLTSDEPLKSSNGEQVQQPQTELSAGPETPVVESQPPDNQQPAQPKEEEEPTPAAQPSQLMPVKVPAASERRRLLTTATPSRRSTLPTTAATPPASTASTATAIASTTMSARSATTPATDRREWASPEEYVRAIRLVRGLAYPWPPPTKGVAAAAVG